MVVLEEARSHNLIVCPLVVTIDFKLINFAEVIELSAFSEFVGRAICKCQMKYPLINFLPICN